MSLLSWRGVRQRLALAEDAIQRAFESSRTEELADYYVEFLAPEVTRDQMEEWGREWDEEVEFQKLQTGLREPDARAID